MIPNFQSLPELHRVPPHSREKNGNPESPFATQTSTCIRSVAQSLWAVSEWQMHRHRVHIKANYLSETDHFVWLSHVHGSVFLPASQHWPLCRLSRDNLKHFCLPNPSHQFNFSHCNLCTVSQKLPYFAYATLVGCVAQLAERRSLAGELTLSCALPAVDGWPLCG